MKSFVRIKKDLQEKPMIAYLQGYLLSRQKDAVVLVMPQGVGYQIYVSGYTLQAWQHHSCAQPPVSFSQELLFLWIHEEVREGQIFLYGFSSCQEQEWFRFLIQVPGLGPKIALNVLSAFSFGLLQSAIVAKDVKMFQTVSGVGAKLATRIVHDLSLKTLPLGTEQSLPVLEGAEDLMQGLCILGYSQAHAYQAVSKAQEALSGASLEERMAFCLRELGKGLF
jgi:Holliday junction DNA helicase RuvA